MAVTKTLRNRIVGFLIILSLILMVLPLLMKEQAVEVQSQQANEDIIAIDENGALTDENGNILTSAEPDYATLLAPEQDSSQPAAPLPAPDPEAAPQLNPTPDNEVLSVPAAPSVSEVLTAKPAAPSKVADAQTEILRAPRKATPDKSSSAQPSKAAADNQIVAPRGTYTIQVGVFSQQSNAENVMRKLRQARIEAFTENVTINSKAMVRVYAGSADSRAALEPVLKDVERLTGAKGKIVSRK